MDGAALLLAATPLPILIYYGLMYVEEHLISDLFGCLSSVWAIMATFFVLWGFPGFFFFPIMFGTIALGGYLEYGRSRHRWELVQGLVMTVVLIIVVIMLEAL